MRLFNSNTCSILADTLIRFRWVALQLGELEKCSSQYEIETQLAELPEGLDEIYSRILKKIDKKHRADTRTFLQWLAFCKRPLRIEEIAETITMDFTEKSPVFNQGKRYADPRDILVRCSSFVAESEGKYGWLNSIISVFEQQIQVSLSCPISLLKSILFLLMLRNISALMRKPLIRRSWNYPLLTFYSLMMNQSP